MKARSHNPSTGVRILPDEETDGYISAAGATRGTTLYAKPVICESTIAYAVYSGEGRFLAFVESMGDVMMVANSFGLRHASVH